MRKVIAGMNMTLDGFCDHTAMTADDEIHEHYNDLLRGAGTLIYGRITYQLMESYWPTVVNNPTGNDSEDSFALLIDNLDKIVFSRSLKKVDWKNSRVATNTLEEEISILRKQPGKDILIGSPSLIVAAANQNLVDEYQFQVHPVIVGSGLRLFENITGRIDLKLRETKTFTCGAITLYYEPVHAG